MTIHSVVLILEKLALHNFKNHKELFYEPDHKWNCVTGLNGTGKTNLLESIYFLCLLKGFGTGVESKKVLYGEQFFRIDGTFSIDSDIHRIVIKYRLQGKKEVQRNNSKIKRMADHIGRFPVLLVQPVDDYKILEGSHSRRRLLDHSLAQSFKKYMESLSAYSKLLKQRNAMLKDIRTGKNPDEHLFDFYSKTMSIHSNTIISYRQQLVNSIRPDMERLYTIISSNKEIPSLVYEPNLRDETLEQAHARSRELDVITGRTNRGPHKDDVSLMLDEQTLKDSSSQGQRKSFLLAFKLAVYLFMGRESGQLPILLLDDLFDKLDNQRVSNLLGLLNAEEFGQVFITDKDHKHLLEIMSHLSFNFKHLAL